MTMTSTTTGRTPTTSSARAPVRRWVRRRPISAFLLLAFTLVFSIGAVAVLIAHGVLPGGGVPGRIGIDMEEFASMLMMLGGLFPAMLIVTWVADGRDGLRALGARMTRWRFGAGWWATILLGMPVFAIGLGVALGDDLGAITPGFVGSQALALLINFVVINLWEESTWAGFLQTRLERRLNIFVSAVLTAVPFAVFHLVLAFLGPFSAGSVLQAFVQYLVVGLILRLAVSVVLRGARDSLLAVGLLHSVFNRTNNSDGIVAGLIDGSAWRLGAIIAPLVITLVGALVLRKRLGKAYRRALDRGKMAG